MLDRMEDPEKMVKQMIIEMEEALVDRVDLVLAASEHLAARFPRHKTLLVPHGADIALFSAPESLSLIHI